ncbi:MAG: MmcQ/YjbR family DNA-binding protein [Rhizomicrobium sp.]
MPVTKAYLRKIALSFPGAIEASSYGQPAFKVEKKFFTRLRSEDDSMVWMVDSIDERDNLIEMDPKTYFITDHYKNYPSVLVRIARIDKAMLRKMLERRWRAVASKKLLRAAGEASGPRRAATAVGKTARK